MKVTFWGTRGSIATPGADTLRYGGNTSCVEVRSSKGTLVVIDGGSGLHLLGKTLPPSQKGALLISHTHWDHIQGIPFFFPFLSANSQWDIYAPKGLEHSISQSLIGEMQYQGFPLTLEQLGSNVRYHELVEGVFAIDDIIVKTFYLNHPALTLGYRLEVDNTSLVYCCDHEPYSLQLAEGKTEHSRQNNRLTTFINHADLAIFDAQYTMEEYKTKRGWGHGTIEYVTELCRNALVKKVAFTHHDPYKSDNTIDSEVAQIQQQLKEQSSLMEVFGAAEGHSIEVSAHPANLHLTDKLPTPFHEIVAIEDPSILIAIANSTLAFMLCKCIEESGTKCRYTKTGDTALQSFCDDPPTLVILENHPPEIDISSTSYAMNQLGYRIPIVAIVNEEEDIKNLPDEISGSLVTPFSELYAKSFIHSWLLRNIHRWRRPITPKYEANRLADLNALEILDTTFEERFDRLTRIAALYFEVPYALLTLVDTNRDWFKSFCGNLPRETIWANLPRENTREASFCAHLIPQKKPLIVPDTLLDNRFADNPLVTTSPYIRFYAGQPMILPSGSCIGSFCILDTRPRDFNQNNLDILGDFRDLAMQEILRR
ncbi:MAG: GAF domain-containing protein [Parachlamydiaceae bacterium]|nr:GAF domain-containing protein [Parachlamydiaceae bacterium]